MLIGYTRPYQDDLQCEEQIKQLEKINCSTVISEEHSSAKKRKELKHMIGNLNEGDKVVIEKIFVLADSIRHLLELLEEIQQKGAYLQSLHEGIDTSNPNGYQFGDIVKHLVHFQSDVISERTKRGLYEAKQKGSIPGRPRKPDENVKRAIVMYQSGNYSLAQIKDTTGISKSTLYRYLEN